jgi:LmbE family N-acetylglucosaminyl deacetylase
MNLDTIVVAPHSDDAALSLGGAITASRLGRAAVIVVFSTTNFRVGGLGAPELVSALRRREDKNALLPWINSLVFLDQADHSLKTRGPGDAQIVIEKLESALQNLCWGPDTLFLFPLGLGDHPDHLLLHQIGQQFSLPCRKGYYEDLPYAATESKESCKFGSKDKLTRVAIASNFDAKARLLRFYRSQGLSIYMPALERYHSESSGEVIYLD